MGILATKTRPIENALHEIGHIEFSVKTIFASLVGIVPPACFSRFIVHLLYTVTKIMFIAGAKLVCSFTPHVRIHRNTQYLYNALLRSERVQHIELKTCELVCQFKLHKSFRTNESLRFFFYCCW